jgi:ribonuclease P protein component
MVPNIKKPVWAMVVVTVGQQELTSEKLRESALKIFRKMEWVDQSTGCDDACQG